MYFQRLGVASLCALVLYVAVSIATADRTNVRWRCAHDENIAKGKMTYKVRLPSRMAETEQEEEEEEDDDDDEFQPYRMHIEYDQSLDINLQPSARDRLKRVVEQMRDFYESVITVRRVEGPLLLERDCLLGLQYVTDDESDTAQCALACVNTTCGTDITIPEDHLKACTQCMGGRPSDCETVGEDGAGVNADFIFYIAAINDEMCPQTDSNEPQVVAYSSTCQLEEEYDRPIAGFANFCPYAVESMTDEEVFLAVTEHEAFHTLVFSAELFPWYRDENGDPRTPRDENGYPPIERGSYVISENTVREVVYEDWETLNGPIPHSVNMLVTPRVMEEARKHFGCSTLEGLELENGGGPGTAASHWEKRLLEWEIMTGTLEDMPVFSSMSLAVLDDSGWYRANYSAAEILLWGLDAGCEFAGGSCGGYIESHLEDEESLSPFCNELNDNGVTCNLQRTAGAFCDLIVYEESLPRAYQYRYFQDEESDSTNATKLGGISSLPDFCPYYVAYDNYVCENPEDSRGTGMNNTLAETYGPGSKCFDTINQWSVQEVSSGQRIDFLDVPGAGCYQYECRSDQLIIIVLEESYTCSSDGQELSIDVTYEGYRHTGTIVCPAYSEICYDVPTSLRVKKGKKHHKHLGRFN